MTIFQSLFNVILVEDTEYIVVNDLFVKIIQKQLSKGSLKKCSLQNSLTGTNYVFLWDIFLIIEVVQMKMIFY